MSDRPVVYVGPDKEVIRRYSEDVCKHLAELSGNNSYLEPDVVGGLAEYLDFLAGLTAKNVNRGCYELLDNVNA